MPESDVGPGADAADPGADDALSDDALSDAAGEVVPPQWCDGVMVPYAPGGGSLDVFPDDFWRQDLGNGPVIHFGDAAFLETLPENFRAVYRDLDGLGGFGVNAGIVFRVEEVVPELTDAASAAPFLTLYELGPDGAPSPVAYEVRTHDEGRGIAVWPLRPLNEGTRHALVLTSDAGGCLETSPTMRSILTGTVADTQQPGALASQAADTAALLERLALKPDQVALTVLFTTREVTAPSLAAAADVVSREWSWEEPPTCETTETDAPRRCSGVFTGFDYRREDGTFGGEPAGSWSIPVDFRLPAGDGPFPVVLFGHGINGGRQHAGWSAGILNPLGIAVMAIDAPWHNDHPLPPPSDDELAPALAILGADLTELSLDARAIGANFRQAASDKLQLLTLLANGTDLDGDGDDDLDLSRLGYHGVSMGGLMGPEIVALHGGFSAMMLSVAGGRLTTIFTDADLLSIFVSLLQSLAEDPADADRMIPVVQAVIDGGDPALWAAHILADRFDDSPAPSVLVNMSMGDAIIPPTATHALTRALLAPVVEPLQADPGLVETIAAPVSDNLGAATAGVFQFDRVRDDEDGAVGPAEHHNMPGSVEGRHQARRFFQGWLDGAAVIADPYAETETPSL